MRKRLLTLLLVLMAAAPASAQFGLDAILRRKIERQELIDSMTATKNRLVFMRATTALKADSARIWMAMQIERDSVKLLQLQILANRDSIRAQAARAPVPGPQGPQGPPGQSITGPAGPAGAPGQSITGPQGPAGQSITGPAGPQGTPGTSITGPQGAAGPAPVLTMGTVTTGNPGTAAAATFTGSGPYALQLTVPRGATGATGPAGPAGQDASSGRIFLADIVVTQSTQLLGLSSGKRDVTVPGVAGLLPGDRIVLTPGGTLTTGYTVTDAWCQVSGIMIVRVDGPALAVLSSYSLPYKVTVLR